MNRVPGGAELVGETEESLGLSLRVMEEQDLGHGRQSNLLALGADQVLERGLFSDRIEVGVFGRHRAELLAPVDC